MRRFIRLSSLGLMALLAGCVAVPARVLTVTDMLPKSDTGRAPAAPAYTVFFDLDSAALTTEAIATLDRLAADPARPQWTRILVTGHADRSGSERRNRALSVKRVEAVRQQLLRAGIPEALIATAAYGERRGLVATSDSAVEPQNRRVEIYVLGN